MLNLNQMSQPPQQPPPPPQSQMQPQSQSTAPSQIQSPSLALPHPQLHYAECRPLPAINETFAQFSQHRLAISLLSPLDLSLRTTSNIVPITPPSTPSPPRKRPRLMSEENYLWRPHMALPLPLQQSLPLQPQPTGSSHFHFQQQHQQQQHPPQQPPQPAAAQLGGSCYGLRRSLEAAAGGERAGYGKSNFHGCVTKNNFEHIPASQSSVTGTAASAEEDETIVLTEDEDETVVSSHDYNEYATDAEEEESEDTIQVHDENEEAEAAPQSPDVVIDAADDDGDGDANEEDDDEDEEVFVDILSNDDDELPPQQLQLLQPKALRRNELLYEDEELHHQAVDGLAKLFDRDFGPAHKPALGVPEAEAGSAAEEHGQTEKVYLDLSGSPQPMLNNPPPIHSPVPPPPPPTARKQKAERRRTKLRKHAAIDEETISPVSGTIIRKLRDDEELVVRKGDIDPAFNVVEITEEAKAILASIDNKIGDYMCQLCRTVYDDAFMLAQHRCPRIVHIEYKCSECEKVFNCPANLASHRRWHKPKSEMQAGKKRAGTVEAAVGGGVDMESSKTAGEDSSDGVYPCPQCGKTFRRFAYLKKHQVSHQMLENLKNMDFFNAQQQQHQQQQQQQQQQLQQQQHTQSAALAPPLSAAYVLPRPPHCPLYGAGTPKNYAAPQRFAGFPFQPFDQRRFYSLGELYLSQQLERSSAFQYVHANHLRQLSNVAHSMLPPPPLPVK
ncbi:hypothetical protein KR222_010909 [Zaprionus bogoriensis]|nr:hypothetical protein KR222_010909 [Zaprionus bogoriensis]